jgi:hypothetical protein
MATPREHRQHATQCLELANAAADVYVKMALMELAQARRVNAKPFIYFAKHRALYVPSGGDKLMDEVALTVIKDFCSGLLSEV